MSTDRELLKLAAKAVGIANPFSCWRDVEGDMHQDWNPLSDDGDALRLAVKLGLSLHPSEDDIDVVISHTFWCATETWEEHAGDHMDATRRAIVCAAAEIGRSLP